MILDRSVLCRRLDFWRKCECNFPLIVLVNSEFLLENTAQYHWGVSLKLEYKLNFPHTYHKG